MHEAITKILNPIYGVPPHLSGGKGVTPAQAYGVEIKPLPAIADLEARRSALNAITQTSQEGSVTVTDLVMGVPPQELAESVQRVAVAFSTQQLLRQQAADAYQSIMNARMELVNSPEMWNWTRKELDKRIAESVNQLKDAAGVLGMTLMSTETKDPNEVSVEITGKANVAIRQLTSLSRRLPHDSQTVSDPTARAVVYAKPAGDLPVLLLDNPDPEAVAAHEVAVVIKKLARRSPGALLAALALDLLPGYSLEVAEDWAEVERRSAMLANAGKPDNSGHESVYISMGAGGDTVQGGGDALPTL